MDGVGVTMASIDAVNVDAILARSAEHGPPKKIAQINGYDVRIAKIDGDRQDGGAHAGLFEDGS